jgi:hypothetical protein
MFDMMVGFFVFILMIIVVIMIIVFASKRRRNSLKNHPLPDQLGIIIKEVVPISQALDRSLPSSYRDQVKYRVLREKPKWTDHEYEWTFFELKRYFVINNLLKSVSMFSMKVDDIWHEMLMFTREYETFSKNFYQEFLHHIPNTDSTPIPGERAFFDWVYLSLFESTSNSRVIWGDFLQHPIKREILDDFRKLSEEELLTKYFRSHDQWFEVKVGLIRKMKREIIEADHVMLGKKSLQVPPSTAERHYFQFALGAAVFYSIYEDDQFQEQMYDWYPSNYYKASQPSGGNSCSTSSCGSSDNHDSGGGSSCSSCGSGCSS